MAQCTSISPKTGAQCAYDREWHYLSHGATTRWVEPDQWETPRCRERESLGYEDGLECHKELGHTGDHYDDSAELCWYRRPRA